MAIHYVDIQPKKSIRQIKQFSAAALKQGKDKELMFWYSLRALDINGCGHIPLAAARKALINHFGYTPITFDRHLRLARNKVLKQYEKGRAVIEIYAPEKLAEWFNTYDFTEYLDYHLSDAVKLPRKAFLWDASAHRVDTYYIKISKRFDGSFDIEEKHRFNAPITRKSLENITGVERRQQQRYDSSISPYKSKHRRPSLEKRIDPTTNKPYTAKKKVIIKGREVEIDKQNGNIYTSQAYQSVRGRLGKASKSARERQRVLLAHDGKQTEASHRVTTPIRRFFKSFQHWYKLYQIGKANADDAFYKLPNSNSFVKIEGVY